jgi:hypothetical protein
MFNISWTSILTLCVGFTWHRTTLEPTSSCKVPWVLAIMSLSSFLNHKPLWPNKMVVCTRNNWMNCHEKGVMKPIAFINEWYNASYPIIKFNVLLNHFVIFSTTLTHWCHIFFLKAPSSHPCVLQHFLPPNKNNKYIQVKLFS